jgi:hypothetical protein
MTLSCFAERYSVFLAPVVVMKKKIGWELDSGGGNSYT